MKQVYKITYPTGKIYIGKDSIGSHRYFGSPDMDFINKDFENLSKEIKLDYSIRKQILWESETASEKELSEKEVEFIKLNNSNDPKIGYNQWPKFKGSNK
ncbi:MAG: GIY-YIG nuclease family protein [Bacteroidetes bacterium]|nr:GIY-YIG nuclease family protein [Bacteroidota bacterium]